MSKRIAEICQARIATGKYDAEGAKTKCNFLLADVAEERGYVRLKGLTANQQIALMEGSPEWREIEMEATQELANQDKLVAAGWPNLSGPHGHVAIVVPGKMMASGKWKCLVPTIAQAGPKTFYGQPLSMGFSPEHRPRFFVLIEGGNPGGY